MKSQIDNLMRSILHDLARTTSMEPPLATLFRAIRVDGLSKAVDQRATLRRWAEDVTLPADVQHYAQERVAALPDF